MPSRQLSSNLTRVDKSLERMLHNVELELIRNYVAAMDRIRVDLAKIYEKYAVAGKLTLAEMTKYNRLKSLEKQLAEAIRPAVVANSKILNGSPVVNYEEAFYQTSWAITQEVGVDLQWGLLKPEGVRAAAYGNAGFRELHDIAIKNLRRGGIDKIDRAVTQGLIRGSSFPQMSREIRKAITGTAKDAVRIARTEGQRAQALGQQESYDQAQDLGVEMQEIWDATLDSRTRNSHGALDGKPRDEEHGGWYTSVGWVAGPLQSGVASFDIQCRCRVRGQIEGYEPKVRRIRDKGLQPYQTYDEWKKGVA